VKSTDREREKEEHIKDKCKHYADMEVSERKSRGMDYGPSPVVTGYE